MILSTNVLWKYNVVPAAACRGQAQVKESENQLTIENKKKVARPTLVLLFMTPHAVLFRGIHNTSIVSHMK